jgi:hypothetical protein
MHDTPSDTEHSEGDNRDESTAAGLEEAIGMPIPDEHVGAFVAEVFEDAERSTEWEDVVESMVAPEARDAWNDLDPVEQVQEVLAMADTYDRKAADALAAIEVSGGDPDPETEADFDEAKRLRRNADAFRDGVADAYDKGHVDDDELVRAVEGSEFDTDAIARREDELERVTSAYDFDYRPYGGTLMQDREESSPDYDPDIPETF